MNKEELYGTLSEEIRQKLAGCKTQDELRKVLAEAGVEPLDDALMDTVAGGWRPFIVRKIGSADGNEPNM